jgi:methylenetetrahydrofolate dehydrogenase (NADP+)/methenyltetrahydrofolate cyclohydrolase
VAVRSGDDPASGLYTKSQARACTKEGIRFSEEVLPAGLDTDEVLERLDRLNRDEAVSGIILVKPLGPNVNFAALRAAINPLKDVEGVSPQNAGLLGLSATVLHPCTAEAAIELAASTGFPYQGKHVVVVGKGEAVGQPLALLALQRWATTTVCHYYTEDLPRHTRQADALFVAVGSPRLINADMVKPGAVVVDIGINRVEEKGDDGETRAVTVGDVDFASVREVAGHITPVPGGVGPMTVAVLLRNTVTAAERLYRIV